MISNQPTHLLRGNEAATGIAGQVGNAKPEPPEARSQRETASLLDRLALAAAQAYASGSRSAIFAAAEMRRHRYYRRLGYRTQGAYSLEEFGVSGRTFRALATLGDRLSKLPRARAAYLSGEISFAHAEAVAEIASPETEERWVRQSHNMNVRQLKRAARHAQGVARDTGIDEPRRRVCFPVPGWMLGKAYSVSELAARVAGADLPPGTRWEMIAAEFLSGAEPRLAAEKEPAEGETVPTIPEPWPPAGDVPEPSEGNNPLNSVFKLRRCMPAVARYGYRRSADYPLPERLAASTDDLGTPEPDVRQEAGGLSGHGPPTVPELSEPQEDREATGKVQTPWQLHRALRAAFDRERKAASRLGGALLPIREQQLWRGLAYKSFDHYVRDRLGISARVAHRLVRLERRGESVPALKRAYARGELSILKAELLLRVFELGVPREAERAWVEYASRMTFQRLSEAVRWAECRAAETRADEAGVGGEDSPAVDQAWAMSDGMPPREDLTITPGSCGEWWSSEPVAGCAGTLPTFAGTLPEAERQRLRGFLLEPHPKAWATQSAVAELVIWMEDGEKELFDRAIAVVREIRGEDWALWACVNDLMDHFLAVYDDEPFKTLVERYPLFARDAWQCQAPGCSCNSALHLHHIKFRGQGGGDESRNLVVLCDFHHLVLHKGWIRCHGEAPDRLCWEFGIGDSENQESAIARFLGQRRVGRNEMLIHHSRTIKRLPRATSAHHRSTPADTAA
jgi:hypothetical protein